MKFLTPSLVCAFLLSSSVATSFSPQSTIPVVTTTTNLDSETSLTTASAAVDDIESGEASSTSANRMGPKSSAPGFLRKKLPGLPWHRLPDWLTYARCLSIPGLVVLFYLPGKHIETAILFALASFTDWLDGFLARRWDISSSFGAFLDPVADKLMVSTALILLAGRYGRVVAIPTAIILAREISVSALREWMAQRGERDAVKVGFQGKLKTAITMLALTILMALPAKGAEQLKNVAFGLLSVCSVITVTSGSVYFKAAAPVLLSSRQ